MFECILKLCELKKLLNLYFYSIHLLLSKTMKKFKKKLILKKKLLKTKDKQATCATWDKRGSQPSNSG
jgi:hypothetical protein